MLTVLAFYFGNRFGQVFDFNTMEITDGALVTVNSIVAAPAAISTASVPMLYAIGLAITVLIVWLYTFMYAGNYRYGEEAGSAKWGTLKEGVAFKDQTDPSNNLLFTKNYGLALKKPKFDLEHDRNLNVMVIGGSGSGKTRNYVKPNLMQLNASYFLTDPKGTSLPECGYLFRDNGYRIRAFNTIEFNKSMHYNPLKYVKTDADILSFVNCLISNTNGDNQAIGIILSSSTVTAMEPVPMTMSNSIRFAQRLAMHPSSTAEQSIQITCASNIRMMNMKHFAGAISTRRHTVISNTLHVSSTSATADFEKGSARMPAQPKTSLKAKSSISTTATSSRMRTDRIQRKSPQKGFGMNSAMPA